MASLATYLLNLLIATSQWFNCLIGGVPDETMSARAWRAKQRGKILGKLFVPLIDIIFYLITLGAQTAHCQDSYESERSLRHMPASYRD